MPVELPELVITSKTQSPETIRQLMKDQGYEDADFQVDGTSDQPAEVPAAPPAAEPETPAAAEPEVPAAGQPAGDEVDDEEEEEEAPPPAAAVPAPPPAKPKSGSAKLKEKLTAKEQELATLRAENERLKTQAPQPASATPPPAAAPPTPEPAPELRAKPKFEDFAESDDQLAAFTEAVGDWTYDKREFDKAKAVREEEVRTAPAREAKAAADAEQQEIARKFVDQVTVVRQQHPTFNEEIALIPPTPVMVQTVTRQRDGAELALWLARNPDELADLNEKTRLPDNFTPQQHREAVSTALMELGRIRWMKDRDGMPERPTSREAAPPPPPAAAPPNQTPPAPAAAAPPATPAPAGPTRVKPQPVVPVGSRGATTQKTLAQMTPAEIRAMNPDEYRRRVEKGERFN